MSEATEACRAQLEREVRLQAGEPGWWQVWGQSAWNIRKGDVLVFKADDELEFFEVGSVEIKNTSAVIHPVDGDVFRFGLMFRGWLLFRQGTKHTLASF